MTFGHRPPISPTVIRHIRSVETPSKTLLRDHRRLNLTR